MSLIQSPLTDAMLQPLSQARGDVVVYGTLSDDEYRRLADWTAGWPAIDILVLQGLAPGSKFRDLDFVEGLRFFPRLRGFGITAHDVEDVSGLRNLPASLEALALSGTYPRRFSLKPIAHLSALRELDIEGPRYYDLEVLGQLTNLEQFGMRSFTLPDLSMLLPLERLWLLAVRLGGTRNLSLLPRVGKLKYLELWRVSKLSDLSVIGDVETLQLLFLQHLSQVHELPQLGNLRSLRHVTLDGVKPVSNLRPLCAATALESLVIAHMPQIEPEDVRCVADLPALKRATLALRTRQKCDQAKALVNLPLSPWYHAGEGFQFA